MRILVLLLSSCLAAAEPILPDAELPQTVPDTISELTEADRAAMAGVSWHEGCPVPLDDLRVLRFTHLTHEGGETRGEVIVHAEVAKEVLATLQELRAVGFSLTGARPVREHDGDDDKSMAADNTSAFNCRKVSGSSRFSEHSYGRAIDLNPLRNPWVRGQQVEPPEGRAWLERDDRPGVITADGPVVGAFSKIGWSWGGLWRSSRDYQHFSESGR